MLKLRVKFMTNFAPEGLLLKGFLIVVLVVNEAALTHDSSSCVLWSSLACTRHTHAVVLLVTLVLIRSWSMRESGASDVLIMTMLIVVFGDGGGRELSLRR